MKSIHGWALFVGLACLPCGAARAHTSYEIQSIIRSGDRAGNLLLKKDASFFIGALNDRGQILLVTDNSAGGQALIQCTEGDRVPIAARGGDAPNGKWSDKVSVVAPVSMNQRGDAVFTADVTTAAGTQPATFRWDASLRQVTPVVNGLPAIPNLSSDAGSLRPVLNNQDEIALAVPLGGRPGQPRDGVFLLAPDNPMLPIALPDAPMPDNRTLLAAVMPSLTDDGRVAFLARAAGDDYPVRPCAWEQGAFSQLAVGTTRSLGTLHFLTFTGIWANNQNRNLLLAAHQHSLSGASNALYFLSGGQFVPVLLPGQPLPDGGRFLTVQPQEVTSLDIKLATGVSAPNDAGQHVILALLEHNVTAAYLMDANGRLTPILRSGAMTKLGKVTSVGWGGGKSQGAGLNNAGQVALTVRFTGGVDTVVLMTPTAP